MMRLTLNRCAGKIVDEVMMSKIVYKLLKRNISIFASVRVRQHQSHVLHVLAPRVIFPLVRPDFEGQHSKKEGREGGENKVSYGASKCYSKNTLRTKIAC